ncbi:hypothetical protein BJ912DRAFT_860531 [Pholiota molesta]|nr:hypothetical protein BJ912DRAFT_860531 [Pholiota molesta]
MLNFALEYRKAVQNLTGDEELNLEKYKLTRNEWAIAEHLRDVLKDATSFFSQSKPNIDGVIPAMDYIDLQLNKSALNSKYSMAIKTAISLGKKTLNRYYNLSDHSEIYRIAMVLHPRHKLDYFKRAGWDPVWIDTAQQIVRDEFERSYVKDTMDDMDIDDANPPPVRSFPYLCLKLC